MTSDEVCSCGATVMLVVVGFVTVTFWFLGKLVTKTCWMAGTFWAANTPPMNVESRTATTTIPSFLFNQSPPFEAIER